MKKIFVLLPLIGILAGCAAGINHNIAQINGRTYLVETKVDNVIGLYQYSRPSTFVDLTNKDIGQELAQEYVEQVAKKCRSAANRRANASRRQIIGNFGTTASQKTEADAQEVYECIVNSLSMK